MILNKVRMRNFKCFEELDIDLPQLSVIVGENAAGKTAVLEAISIAIGSFLIKIEEAVAPNIQTRQVRTFYHSQGNRATAFPQYPAAIGGEGVADGCEVAWFRELRSSTGSTTTKDARSIINIAAELQHKIRNGDQETVLPFLGFYGAERLRHNDKSKKDRFQGGTYNRFSGYKNCLNAIINEKDLIDWFRRETYIELQKGAEIAELSAVKRAIETFVTQAYDQGSDDCRVFFDVETDELMIYFEEANQFPLSGLSDGYRNMMYVVADIAYRMALLNPQFYSEAVRQTPGIVLIDELDLHLHPSWQQHVIQDLRKAFPMLQFIVTTHAPAIINSVKAENLIILKGKEVYYPGSPVYGRDVNSILREIMGVEARPIEIQTEFQDFYDAIDREDFTKARELLNHLEETIGGDPEITAGRVTLELEEMDV